MGILHRSPVRSCGYSGRRALGPFAPGCGLALFNMLRGMGLDSVRLRWPNEPAGGQIQTGGNTGGTPGGKHGRHRHRHQCFQ